MKTELVKRVTENPMKPIYFLMLKPENEQDESMLERIVMESNEGLFFNPGTVLRAGKRIASITMLMHRDTI